MWTTKEMPAQTGKTVIVTGANAGIGYETALALYQVGAKVVLACRNRANAEEAMAKMLKVPGAGSLEIAVLDLGSLPSVQQFAEAFKAMHNELHLLINNAGVMIPPPGKTGSGFELQFGTNFIGHFALSGLLYPLLAATPGARIVTVSSNAYLHGTIDFDDLRLEKQYDPMRAYAQSKLANVLFAVELDLRIRAKGGTVLSLVVQPGANKTELVRHMSESAFAAAVQRVGTLMEPWQGALPSLYAATMPGVKGGILYEPDQDGGYRGYPTASELRPHGLDKAVAERLWNFAEDATGLIFP